MLVGLTVMVVVAGLGAVIARLGKQPIIVGYIGAGVVLGWMSQGVLMGGNELNDLGGMSKVGVTLLLFLVGLELPIGEMRHLGRSVLGLAVTQVMVSVGLGMGLGLVLGLKLFDAAYFGLAGAFASTVIVVKMLGERRDLQSLYGRLATSLLLVQDFLAMGVLLMLSGVSVGGNRPNDWLVFGLAGVALVVGVAGARKIIPIVWEWVGNSVEVWFVVALGWCLLVSGLVAASPLKFSVELGGFLAGLSLAGLKDHGPIVSRVRPIRDFFLMLFFVDLGVRIGKVANVGQMGLVMGLSVLVLIVNPVVVFLMLRRLGYAAKVAFKVGFGLTQISEFGLILVTAAAVAGQVDASLVGVVGMAAMVTMLLSAYYWQYGERVYSVVSGWGWVGKGKRGKVGGQTQADKNPAEIMLFGHNRMGTVMLPVLRNLGTVKVVDFDPAVVSKLEGGAVYGDIGDREFLEELEWDKCKLVVSTVSDYEDNKNLLNYVRDQVKKKPFVILSAEGIGEATKLRELGADYVVVPHRMTGAFLSEILSGGIDFEFLRGKLAKYV